MIAVVIPYFQRQAGVLRRALASVAAQQGCALPVHVIVVDDASPVPAGPEVAAVQWPAGMQVTVLPRPNGGPGAARNSGLDAAPAGTRFIAFLDSDDEWSANHLARGVAALQEGFDFYFADLFQLNQTVSAFKRAGRIHPSDHPPIEIEHKNLQAYSGDLFNQILTGNVIGTPTVILRTSKLGGIRFRTDLTSAGEDYLFWMEVALSGARIVFSSEVEPTCGAGVNVYTGSGWGTDGHLKRICDEIAYRRAIGVRFDLDAAQKAFVRSEIQRLRTALARDLIHRLRHGKPLPSGLLSAHWKEDPASFLLMPLNLLRVILRR